MQFKKALKYAFPISRNIIQTTTLASKKHSRDNFTGKKKGMMKNTNIMPIEKKMTEM